MLGQDGSASDGGSLSLASAYVKRNLGDLFDAATDSHASPDPPAVAVPLRFDSYRSSDSAETLAWGALDTPCDHGDKQLSWWENRSQNWYGSYKTEDCVVLSKPTHW
jgi:hypothetical protein